MTRWKGLTWDHPRGVAPLRAAATSPEAPPCALTWDVQPLEGFEATPIDQIADRYDLIVLDHPHLGEALAHDALHPLDRLYPPSDVAVWRTQSVGGSAASYTADGRLWALPLDAAAQVSVRRDPSVPVPDTWDDAVALARDVDAALPTAGPHPFLTLCSIAVAYGATPGAGATFLTEEATAHAVDTLRHFVPWHAPATHDNPIALLDAMARGDGPAYSPHVYGYVTYARGARPLLFGDAPRGDAGRRGSVLGGAGLAFSARRTPGPDLLAHVRWLLNPVVQTGFVAAHEGQPGAAAAWDDPALDADTHGFYRATRATIEQAWIRPRQPGAIRFQSAAADEVRACLFSHRDARVLTRRLDALYATTTLEV